MQHLARATFSTLFFLSGQTVHPHLVHNYSFACKQSTFCNTSTYNTYLSSTMSNCQHSETARLHYSITMFILPYVAYDIAAIIWQHSKFVYPFHRRNRQQHINTEQSATWIMINLFMMVLIPPTSHHHPNNVSLVRIIIWSRSPPILLLQSVQKHYTRSYYN